MKLSQSEKKLEVEGVFRKESSLSIEKPFQFTGRELKQLMGGNSTVKKKLNNLMYQVQQRTDYRRKLQEQYSQILQQNKDNKRTYFETRRTKLEHELISARDKICLEEMDTEVLKHMLDRERIHRIDIKKGIEDAKGKLKKVEELQRESSELSNANGEAIGDSQSENVNLNKRKLAEKILSAQEQYDHMWKEIEKSKQRVEENEKMQIYYEIKQKKLIETTKKLRKNNEYYGKLVLKLKTYEGEFRLQYARLLKTFDTNQKDCMVIAKERKEIEKQTDSNLFAEKIILFKEREKEHWNLQQQLAQLREIKEAEKVDNLKYQLDKGEYNPGVASNRYVLMRFEMQELQKSSEEKMGVLRKVMSGIRDILSTLRKNDKFLGAGVWHNLDAIAAIDEIDKETAPRMFSELLLLLEMKIKCISTMFVQSVRYMKAVYLQGLEIGDPNAANKDCFDCSNLDVCLDEMKNFMKFLDIEKGVPQSTDIRRMSLLPSPVRKTVVGRKIPKLVISNNEKEKISASYFDLVRNGIADTVEMIKEKNKKKESTISPEERDMSLMDQNIFGLFTEVRRPHQKVKEDRYAMVKEERIPESEITQKFYDIRLKQKLEQKRRKDIDSPSAVSFRKPKKRVTKLTLQIECAMRKKPAQIVEAATTTFNTLDKFKNSMVYTLKSARASKEKNLIHQSMPNFVSAVLGMKRAKKGEHIEKIAYQCRYIMEIIISYFIFEIISYIVILIIFFSLIEYIYICMYVLYIYLYIIYLLLLFYTQYINYNYNVLYVILYIYYI